MLSPLWVHSVRADRVEDKVTALNFKVRREAEVKVKKR